MDNGDYGNICDDYWDVADANVVCSILEYGTAISAPTQGFFGHGVGSTILDDVQCDGGESTLFKCSHSLNDHNCVQSEAAGVVCSGSVGLQCFVPLIIHIFVLKIKNLKYVLFRF